MAELSRNGHRQRMRDSYLSGGMENAADHNLLELFLSLVIPQKDVKPIAYDLINTFGSLENVITANPVDLMRVKGVGQSTAVALNLIKDINKRIEINKNDRITMINSTKDAFDYCKNLLGKETNEKVALVTLTNDGAVINHYIVKEGTVSAISIDARSFLEYALRDNAAGILIAHNHPHGKATPSVADISFTIDFNATVKKLKLFLVDHIVVGEDFCCSIKSDPRFLIK